MLGLFYLLVVILVFSDGLILFTECLLQIQGFFSSVLARLLEIGDAQLEMFSLFGLRLLFFLEATDFLLQGRFFGPLTGLHGG